MNKQEQIKRLDAIEKEASELRKLLEQPDETAKKWLAKLWFAAYRNSGNSFGNCATFYENSERNKDGWLFQQDWENKKLYYNYHKIYEILRHTFKLNHNEANALVMDVVSKDINCEGLTPNIILFL